MVGALKGLGVKEMKEYIDTLNVNFKPLDGIHRTVGIFGKMKVFCFLPTSLGKVYFVCLINIS